MAHQLNEKLRNAKENLRKKQKLEKQLNDYDKEIAEKRKNVQKWSAKLEVEKEDVEKLHGASITNLFISILGKKDEKLLQEKQEVVEAQLKYKEAKEALTDMEKDKHEVLSRLSEVDHAEVEYERLFQEKERMIAASDSRYTEKLYQLSEQEGDIQANLVEIEEAIQAGNHVLYSLDHAKASLEKAQGWGAFDMFGGGMISTAIKHDHMGDAERNIHDAQHKMRIFQKELLDVEEQFHLDLDVSSLLTFADFFFDGLIADWMVQGKINDTLDQTEQAYSKVSSMIHQLRSNYQTETEKLQDLESLRIRLIEEA